MKIKTKKVYYCGFCKKHSLKSLVVHEQHCTGNINRVCRLCGRKEPLKEIVDKLKDVSFAVILEDIKNELEFECPLCILTIIRCAELNKFPKTITFDLKEELDKWWESINEGEKSEEEWAIY